MPALGYGEVAKNCMRIFIYSYIPHRCKVGQTGALQYIENSETECACGSMAVRGVV